MSWEHAIARELKKRDNPVYCAWFSGEVTSPVQTTDEEGHVNYSGPTIVSCFDGAVQLRADRLQQIPGAEPYHAGQRVALLGHPFAKEPGSQKILILGVVTDVI